MDLLISTIVNELQRPRVINEQIIKHLAKAHSVGRDEIKDFFSGPFSELEEYEIDLLLSPLFTPTFEDQRRFAPILKYGSIPKTQWVEIVESIVDRPCWAALEHGDDSPFRFKLHTVLIERFVHRLRLEAVVPPSVSLIIDRRTASDDQPFLIALSRRAIWDHDGRRLILSSLLDWYVGQGPEDAAKVMLTTVTQILETYQAGGIEDLKLRLKHLLEVTRNQVTIASSPKPFLSQRIQEMHGGGRDQRHSGPQTVQAREEELNLLTKAAQLLESFQH